MSFFKLDSLFEHLAAFIESKIDIYKIELREEASKALSKLMVGLLLFSLGFFFIMFLSMAAGYYFSALLGSFFYGFLIISGIYLLLFTLIFLLKEKLGLKEFFDKQIDSWLNSNK
ncbi:phage holin family protein [Fulvivirga sp. 29W222]|uniref:Phage holin family protein n=1 Tax=Fulvivirga marina TaxID=2494733 RepID=A0A937G3C8_9BACT|nr:phage holin family protein [Fulvivirga marina]MBL6449683.1 phage holin family protein [Fulvivirga marina]